MQNKQIDIMFRIRNSTLMDRIYPKAISDIKIEGVIWVKQMLWAVKVRAKMILKKPSSFEVREHVICGEIGINIRIYASPQ